MLFSSLTDPERETDIYCIRCTRPLAKTWDYTLPHCNDRDGCTRVQMRWNTSVFQGTMRQCLFVISAKSS